MSDRTPGPRTAREALFAELLGELDTLLRRAEALPTAIGTAEAKLHAATVALNEAGDKYRSAVSAFTEGARVELTDYLQRRSLEVATEAANGQRKAMQEAALEVFTSSPGAAYQRIVAVVIALQESMQRSLRARVVEHGLTALLASMLTAGVVSILVR